MEPAAESWVGVDPSRDQESPGLLEIDVGTRFLGTLIRKVTVTGILPSSQIRRFNQGTLASTCQLFFSEESIGNALR